MPGKRVQEKISVRWKTSSRRKSSTVENEFRKKYQHSGKRIQEEIAVQWKMSSGRNNSIVKTSSGCNISTP
jgi:hypothetical protein